MSARLVTVPAQPARRILIVTWCFFCGRKWAPDPLPEYDEVIAEEGFCPSPCVMQRLFFGERPE